MGLSPTVNASGSLGSLRIPLILGSEALFVLLSGCLGCLTAADKRER